jgi:ankyrin repeat protein
MMLCAKNDSQIKLFLSRGHDINYKDTLGQTALHKSVMSGNNSLTKDLLMNGADLFIKNYLGQTPVFFVKNEECLKILLEYGHSDIFGSIDNSGQNVISFNKIVHEYIIKSSKIC